MYQVFKWNIFNISILNLVHTYIYTHECVCVCVCVCCMYMYHLPIDTGVSPGGWSNPTIPPFIADAPMQTPIPRGFSIWLSLVPKWYPKIAG